MTTVPGGTLVVSIDLPMTDTSVVQGGVKLISYQLMNWLEQLRIPATWAFRDPAHSPFALRLATSRTGHEVAILGESSWIGSGLGRTRFVRELSQRVQSAREIGLPISTLSLRDAQLRQNLDVLVKQRISVVRAAPNSAESGFVLPHALRFGVWEARPTICFPTASRWLPAAALMARWTLGKAVSTGSIAHLTIDASCLAEKDRNGLRLVQRVLQYAHRLREENLLATRTLSHLSLRFQKHRLTPPLRSILRNAA